MNQPYRIALYTRVSTEEQVFPEGSIKNQEQRLREFVQLKQAVGPFGEIVGVFTDAGISAKNMDRPAFQQMLSKIEAREVNMVLVTELSRFTRSIKDFSMLWEFLERNKCALLSIKDNFDTSTAAGEFVLMLMVNIAEFERKQTGERISYAFLARAKRGLFNGGFFPLGYTGDSKQRGHLIVNSDEANLVRLIFDTFLREETITKTARALNEKGVQLPRRRRSGAINIDTVHNILRNKSYAGIRRFSTMDGNVGESPAVWEPIIAKEKFERAQALLDRNRHHKRSYLNQRYPYTLSGICFCKTCGERMGGKSAHSKGKEKFPYYEHCLSLTKRLAAPNEKITRCEPPRIPAKIIEPLVWQEAKRLLGSEEVALKLLNIAKAMRPNDQVRTDEEWLQKQLLTTERQIEALAERIARLPQNVDDQIFLNQMAKLNDEKRTIESKLVELRNKKPPQEETTISYDNPTKFALHLNQLLDQACHHPEVQSAIIRQLVQKIEVNPTGFAINFFISKT